MSRFKPSHTELGDLKSTWTNGYNGQKVYFIDNTVLIYTCGSSIKLFDSVTKKYSTFIPPCLELENNTNGICFLTASSSVNKFAYSDTKALPSIYVHDSNTNLISELKEGAEIEYLAIEFSNSEAILALSNIPNMEIIIWSWKTGVKIGRIEIDTFLGTPSKISFSPINWRIICIAYKTDIDICSLELCNTQRFKNTKQRLRLPHIDKGNDNNNFSDIEDEFTYPTNAIAGLEGLMAMNVDQMLETEVRHEIQTLTWTNNPNELFVVAKNNFIFKYTLNENSIKCIHTPEVSSQTAFTIDSTFQILEMKFHRQAMFAICSDHCIRLINGSDLISETQQQNSFSPSVISVKTIIELPVQVFCNSAFNQQYTSLAISSCRGVFILDNPALLASTHQQLISSDSEEVNKFAKLAIDFDQGQTVALANLNPFGKNFLVLKESGCLQTWCLKNNEIINRMRLGVQCSAISAHSKMPLVVVGTVTGQLIFIDMTNEKEPRVIENVRVHEGCVKFLRFNTSGTLLFSIGIDGKLFVIDTRLSSSVEKIILKNDQRLVTSGHTSNDQFEKGFHILGYTEFDGEVVCMDTLDSTTSEITTKVAVGIHDEANWQVIRKVIDDVLPFSASPTMSEKESDHIKPLGQSVLIGCMPTNSSVKRLDYRNTDRPVEYVCEKKDKQVKLACRVIFFEIELGMFRTEKKVGGVYASIRLDLKDEIIKRVTAHSYFLFSDLILTSANTMAASTERFISLLKVPEFDVMKLQSQKGNCKFSYMDLSSIVGSHDFGFNCFARSQNNHFVASGGYDGSLAVHKAGDLMSFTEKRISHYTNGGIQSVIFHSDGMGLIALCHDNSIVNVQWNCNFEPNLKLIRIPAITGEFDRSSLTNLVTHTEKDEHGDGLTWFQTKEKEFFVEEDKEYLPIKKDVSEGLKEIKMRLKELMEENEGREDFAKLKESEFYLDLDELDRLQKETDFEINEIREKTELADLARLYVCEAIKKECWDRMTVKGRGIQAFNTSLLVENYPLKDRSREEENLLERVQMMRKIEINAQKTSNELSYELMKKDNINEFVELNETEHKEDQQLNNNSYLSPNLISLAFKGSISSLFAGDSHLFYNQFQLFTTEQKFYQIILIQDAIHRIKSNFNVEFDLMMQRKNQEIAKIKEKNQRLKQIYSDLSEDTKIAEPRFGDSENPEVIFTVTDEEIKVEKYLTPEQRKLKETAEAEMEKKRELEKSDNWRERGLFDMMGGVLQIRREDELKKEIPVPSFFQERPADEWTYEETKIYAAYEAKCRELEEEREKLKKYLNVEIGKLNEQILECYTNFDNQLFNLHLRKVKTQQAVYQEELKIARLFNQIIVDTELETHERQLMKQLEIVRDEKRSLGQEIQTLKKLVEAFKEEYEIASAEDKAQDKAFMREFSDVYPISVREQLLKLFKKRAKQRMTINKTIANPPHVFVPEFGVDNPFSNRPSTAQQLDIYDRDTEQYLADLDDIENSPGVENYIWERFVVHRREKIAMENNLRVKGLTLTEMNLFFQKRVDEDEAKKSEIEALSKRLAAVQADRLRSAHNLQVQLLMKQGQVEINPGVNVHNFNNCLLIDRDVVESLNKVIEHHGSQKISIMVECKDYKKGIRQLEWEHRKMKMSIEDYIQKQRDITYLKLTREIQQYLENPDYDSNKQKEINILEQTIAFKTAENEKMYSQKAKSVNDIKKSSIKVANTNDQFDDKLKDTNVVLHERKHIKEELIAKNLETIREEKFQQIIQRRKLVDLAKAQAQEVAFLRSEVERLRMKTFPALVQIEF